MAQKVRGDMPYINTPSTQDDLQWGSPVSLVLGPIASPSVNGAAVVRTTFQAGASQIVPFPYAWVYDVQFFLDNWAVGGTAGVDPAMALDVVVCASLGTDGIRTGIVPTAVEVSATAYGTVAGDPFKNATDFASLLTANVNVWGTSQPTMAGIAFITTINKTYRGLYYSARSAASGLIKVNADPTLISANRAQWGCPNYTGATGQVASSLANRAGETMLPILRRGQVLNLRYSTNGSGANNTATNLYAVVTLVPGDAPFTGE